MSDITTGPASQATTGERRSARPWLAPLPGVLFVATFVVGLLISSSPDDGASDKTWTDFYGNRGNRIAVLVGGYLLLFAGMLLLIFFTRLHRRVYAASDPGNRDPLPLIAATAAGTLVAAGGLISATISGGAIFGSLPIPTDAGLLRFTSDVGFVLPSVGGMFAVAVAIVTITLHAHRSGYFGRVLSIFSGVAAVAGVASAMFFPIAVVLIWVLVISIVLARRPAPA